jgi:hypothetical protein
MDWDVRNRCAKRVSGQEVTERRRKPLNNKAFNEYDWNDQTYEDDTSRMGKIVYTHSTLVRQLEEKNHWDDIGADWGLSHVLFSPDLSSFATHKYPSVQVFKICRYIPVYDYLLFLKDFA